MISSVVISLPADPIPLARPRFSGRRAYLPKRSRDYRDLLQAAAVEVMQNLKLKPLEGQLACHCDFYRRYRVDCRNYGDIDNHLKATLDALNGIAFADDAQVISISASKHTDKLNPRAIITLRQL